MTDEQKLAVERLRRLESETSYEVYGDGSTIELCLQRLADESVVSDLYLAEHFADDAAMEVGEPNINELKAVAERIRRMRDDSDANDGGYPATPEGRNQSSFDHLILADWALPLLSDDPVTAEWLRKKWGAEISLNGLWMIVPLQNSQLLRCSIIESGDVDGVTVGTSNGIDVTTQGQFTMLAYGLGLTPKEEHDV